MVSCFFCRRRIFHERAFSNTFAKNAFNVYRCKNCKLWFRVQKIKTVESEVVIDVKAAPFKKGDEVGSNPPAKLLIASRAKR